MQITAGLENVKAVVTPLEILRERLSRANIILRQKKEFSQTYSNCIAGENFEYITSEDPPTKYKLINNLLMIEKGYYNDTGQYDRASACTLTSAWTLGFAKNVIGHGKLLFPKYVLSN